MRIQVSKVETPWKELASNTPTFSEPEKLNFTISLTGANRNNYQIIIDDLGELAKLARAIHNALVVQTRPKVEDNPFHEGNPY